jgi:glycosyltransferase involved in cell wall biosynthesis
MNSRITVVIPNYNGGPFLRHLFESLQQQTLKHFKCLFVDDGSTDDSVAIAREYQAVLSGLEIQTYPNGGIGENWNRGMAQADTEFFTLLHCDDACEPGYLAAMLALMDAYPTAAIGHCAALTMDQSATPIESLIEDYKRALYLPAPAFCRSLAEEYACLLAGDYINCPTVIYRTAAVRTIGLFNVRFKQVLDWEYWFRCLLAGYEICGSNQPLYWHRRHGNNATLRNSQMFDRYLEELQVLEWAFERGAAQGLVEGSPSMAVVRNIVIYDIAVALRQGDRQGAKAKAGFLADQVLASKTVLAGLQLLIRWGAVGGWALAQGIASYVRVRTWFG